MSLLSVFNPKTKRASASSYFSCRTLVLAALSQGPDAASLCHSCLSFALLRNGGGRDIVKS
jgi:hypothetical protein